MIASTSLFYLQYEVRYFCTEGDPIPSRLSLLQAWHTILWDRLINDYLARSSALEHINYNRIRIYSRTLSHSLHATLLSQINQLIQFRSRPLINVSWAKPTAWRLLGRRSK